MSKKDYIPQGDSAFNDFQENFVTVVNAYKANWGFATQTHDEWTLLTTTAGVKKMLFDGKWAIVKTGVFTRPEKLAMHESRRSYESGNPADATDTSIRLFIKRYIRNNTLVTNEQKAEMGLTIPDEVKTPAAEPPAGNEIIGTVKSAKHLAHHNEVQTPGQMSKAKESNIENVHIFIAFTEANVTIAPAINAFVFDGIVKRSVYDREFEPAQEGKRAWYFVRVMSKGKAAKYGPPSALWNSVIM